VRRIACLSAVLAGVVVLIPAVATAKRGHAAPVPLPDSNWAGTTNAYNVIEFSVSRDGSTITSLSAQCADQPVDKASSVFNGGFRINHQRFHYADESVDIRGRFTGPKRAQGVISIADCPGMSIWRARARKPGELPSDQPVG
jgi:hypothetical protein